MGDGSKYPAVFGLYCLLHCILQRYDPRGAALGLRVYGGCPVVSVI